MVRRLSAFYSKTFHIIFGLMGMGIYTPSGERYFRQFGFCLLSEKGQNFKEQNLLLESQLFPYRADTFPERDWCEGKQRECHKSCLF